MAKQRFSKKIMNICIVITIIAFIIIVAWMFSVKYSVKGESNMPFFISKISIVSTVDGKDVESDDEKWSIDVIQNNDVYIYIEKNNDYKKEETIDSIEIENLRINQEPKVGGITFYKPSVNDVSLFQNIDENIANTITFKGSMATDTRNLEVSNQGGVINFRAANDSIGNYKSNEDEINYKNLLNKLNLGDEDVNAIIAFNIKIELDSGVCFESNDIELKIPNDEIIEQGTVGKEYTDLNEIVFKRVTVQQ